MFHKHQWAEQGRQFGFVLPKGFTTDRPDKKYCQFPATIVTDRCDTCGKFRQQELRGHVEQKTKIPEAFLK